MISRTHPAPSAQLSSDNQAPPGVDVERLGNLLLLPPAQSSDLSQVATSPVCSVLGLQTPLRTRLMHQLSRLMFNLFPLLVVISFFWLQVQIDTQTTGFIHSLVMIMTVLVELGAIFVWSLFI
ncbi:MAG: hypothetical protein JXB07_15875 [Anaerolineae bacterium]|nr:hypothetical protein [Anaerolineae bacterium]